MRIVYPVLWSRLGREASQEQTVNTVGALARLGLAVTLVLPRGRTDPPLDSAMVRDWFGVRGDFRLVQLASRWAGEHSVRSTLWMRQLLGDAAMPEADLLYSRVPVMLAWPGPYPLPFATDLYRPWPDHWPWLRPFVRRTAARRECLGYVLHSAYAARSYAAAGVPSEKLLVAHNGADPDRMLPRLGKTEARARLGLPAGRPLAVYAGRINPRKGLDQLLALADLRPETLFLLVGSEGFGPVEAAAAGRTNVAILPWQPPERLGPYLQAADLLVIPASSAPLDRFGTCVLPMKTFLYLAAGRPILAPATPDSAELLRDGINALLVPPDRPKTAAAALDLILGDAGLAARLATNAARTAKTLTWDSRAKRIADFLETRLGNF
ncbi:MAG TPA: glycosyltransferase family 4 protein [Allosphingosinicella sp.]|nr:glycosyltransferase family 4 protein [Allosphingosinicella sp.]